MTVSGTRPGLPPPQRASGSRWAAPVVVGAALLAVGYVVEVSWLLVAAWALVVLGVVAVVVDEVRRRRTAREWDAVPTATVAPYVDVAQLATVRRGEGELGAIRLLRRQVPGCPLRRSRQFVAELTGVPSGAR